MDSILNSLGIGVASLSDPQSLNMYAYCGNDPINHVDPQGLFFGWLKKLFRGIAKVFKAVLKAVVRVLANKWVQLALGLVILTLASPFAPLFFSTLGAGEGLISQLTANLLISAVVGVGSVSNYVLNEQVKRRRQQKRKVDQKKTSDLGGAFSAAQAKMVKDLLDRIEKLFGDKKYEDCAALFGGKKNALANLKKAKPLNVNTVNPQSTAAGIDPDTKITNTQAARDELLAPDSTTYALGGKNGYVYLGDRFLSLDPNTQATVFIHELKHVNGVGLEIDKEIDKDYADIREKCGLP